MPYDSAQTSAESGPWENFFPLTPDSESQKLGRRIKVYDPYNAAVELLESATVYFPELFFSAGHCHESCGLYDWLESRRPRLWSYITFEIDIYEHQQQTHSAPF